MAVAREDLKMSYIEEEQPGACDEHYEFMGYLSNDECAHKCYATFGCTRFSAGSCSLGCRISVPHKNHMNLTAVSPDGQCRTSQAGAAGGCILYKLSFYRPVALMRTCHKYFALIRHAKNAAECAHACKNTPGCTKFSAEPNCMDGCRISHRHDRQCTFKGTGECVEYELFR
jgi:hypothetical protein